VMAAYRLLDGLAPADAVALATYDDRIHGIVDFTTDKSLIATALNRMQFSLGMARLDLFGSLAEAMEVLALPAAVSESGNPAPPLVAASSGAGSDLVASGPAALPLGRVAIVLLSTGLSDVREPGTRASLHDRLLTSGVAAYVVALGGALRAPAKKASARPRASGDAGGPSPSEAAAAFAQADRDLKDLAESSGGRAYFPRTAKDLDGAYREIAATLRHLYSLAFVPPAHDQKIHALRVEVRDAAGRMVAQRAGHEGWALLARPAYRAP